MSIHLRHEMARLEKRLLTVSALVEESVQKALAALRERDAVLAREVIDGDAEIDRMEVEVEEECLKTLALYQPVAMDLRFIVAALKINNDLERVGDLATSIAKCALVLAELQPVAFSFGLQEMGGEVLALLRQSLDAFVLRDTAPAYEVRSLDEGVDQRYRDLQRRVTLSIKDQPEHEEALLQMLWVSRSLERIGDHATNIAEDIIYIMDGEIVRHTPMPELPRKGFRGR